MIEFFEKLIKYNGRSKGSMMCCEIAIRILKDVVEENKSLSKEIFSFEPKFENFRYLIKH